MKTQQDHSNSMLALIDADEILYKIGFATQTKVWKVFHNNEPITQFTGKRELNEYLKKVEHPDELAIQEEIYPEPVEFVIYTIKTHINTLLSEVGSTEKPIFMFSGEENFRNKIANDSPFLPAYKGERKDFIKPYHYVFIKQWLLDNATNVKFLECMEADDGLSIHQWDDWSQGEEGTIIISQDKDLDMVPGWHYSMRKGKYFISEREGWLNFFTQMLTGDSTDAIPGLYRLTGTKALAKYKSRLTEALSPSQMLSEVKDLYKIGWSGTEQELEDLLIAQGTLLWMKRSSTLLECWMDWL